jgi:S1-C subfamily serine protease
MGSLLSAMIRAVALSVLAMLAPVGDAFAAIDVDTLGRIKRATVFVTLGQHRNSGSGSGFLVHRDGSRGLVVTNAHVAAKAVEGGLRVVFNSGTRKADSIPATLVGLSRSRDLAVLELNAPNLPEPLQIAPNARAHETQTVHIVGFPFGKGFATNRETPAVTISRGTVSSQRMDINDQTRLMQIDGDLNPGNSGGPIVDDAGQVVGVAVATVRQTNIGFAIPLAPLVEMLAGTLTDLHAERSGEGVRVTGRLLDPHGSVESARLNVRAMKEDAVLDLLSKGVQWKSIALRGKDAASLFSKNDDGSYAALHALPKTSTANGAIVAQIIVKAKGVDRYLPPFRVVASDLSVALSGPDVRPVGADADKASDDKSKGTDKVATLSIGESDYDELFTRSGVAGLIASMSSESSEEFEQSPSNEDERTVKEQLREIIAAQWDEERIKRTFVRSFEAAPNAAAQRRAMELFDLPAMKLLHFTTDRLKPLTSREVEVLKKQRKGDPVAFEKRLDLMREIDAKRNFSRVRVAVLTTSITSLARLINEIKPANTRMSAELLQRDVERVVARIESRIRATVPVILVNQYAQAEEKDLRDYLKQLDSIAMRWFAESEFSAHAAVNTSQFNEAEDEIVQLFKEVRRESLGLAEAPDLDGKNDVEAMDALIQAYGKEGLIEFVLKRRGGEISTLRSGTVGSQFGRPGQDKVSATTLVADLKAMKMESRAFAAALAQFLVDTAYQEKRLTARGQTSKLMTALRERRRSKALRTATSRKARRAQASQSRADKKYRRAEKRQCERTCKTTRRECSSVGKRSNSLCRRSAPKSGKQRSRILKQCAEQNQAQRSSCEIEARQCRERC